MLLVVALPISGLASTGLATNYKLVAIATTLQQLVVDQLNLNWLGHGLYLIYQGSLKTFLFFLSLIIYNSL
jgi:hypothetical protein